MSLRHSIGDLAAAFASIVKTRLELFALEASGQKSNLACIVGMVIGAMLLLGLGFLVFSLALALLFWPTEYRYLALFLLAAIYVVCGVGLLWFVRRKLLNSPAPFAATIEELNSDISLLRSLRTSKQSYSSDNPDN